MFLQLDFQIPRGEGITVIGCRSYPKGNIINNKYIGGGIFYGVGTIKFLFGGGRTIEGNGRVGHIEPHFTVGENGLGAITGNVIGDGETILPAGSMRFFGWCVFSFVIGSAYSSSSCEDEPGGGTEKSSSEDNNDGAGGDAS